MTTRISLAVLWSALPLVSSLLLATAAHAQRAADAAATAIVGVACVDLDEDGTCGARDLPLPATEVRLSNGVGAATDDDGRFHLAAAGAERATRLGDALLPRPESSALFIDAHALGPTARMPAPLTVTFAPAAVVPVELAVRLPERAEAPLPRMAGAPMVRVDDATWIVELPLALAVGHLLDAGGATVPVDAAGGTTLPVRISGREAELVLADTAPDGRVTLVRLRVLRVPRVEGGALVVTAPLEVLARIDLPPRHRQAAPGALLVPVRARPGTEVVIGEAGTVVDASGVAYLWTRAAAAMRVCVRHDASVHDVTLPLTVDPIAAMTTHLAGELRVGAVGLSPFAQGRLEGAVRVPIDDTVVVAGTSIDDELAGAAIAGRLRLQPARALVAPRLADPERDLAVWGDTSRMSDDNPAELALWAHARGPWGEAGLGPARTPLDEGEVGRFDRAVIGPFADAALDLAGVKIGVEAAGDAAAAPFIDVAAWRKAHDEIEASGGRVYWLSHRAIAPGSARVAIELHDPLTGLVVERRTLTQGADYEMDHVSGRVLLAAPLGMSSPGEVMRTGAIATGWRPRLVVDYAHAPAVGEATSHDGAARVFLAAGDVVSAGLRVAVADSAGATATLAGADVSAHPLPFVSLSASAAHSAGDPMAGAGLARSADAGLSFVPPTRSATGSAAGGDAVALRARVGAARSFAAAYGAYRAPGYADAAFADSFGAARAGAEGRLELFDALAASALVDARSGVDPNAVEGTVAQLIALDASARLEGRLGSFRLALDGLHRRAERFQGDEAIEGDASAVGAELGVSLADGVEVFGGHLQRVAGSGDGPGAADPTLTYLGARLPVSPDARVEGRFGVHPDLRPEAAVSASLEEDAGVTRYGTAAVASDAPWGGRGATLVSGARQALGPGADVYAEDRVTTSPHGAPQGARVVGARVRPGPLFAGISVESGTRALETPARWRGALVADAGVSLPSAMVQAFGEVVADDAPGAIGVRHFAFGATVQGRPLTDVTIGARALVARGAPLGGGPVRPESELFVGGAWRPPHLPDVFAHYALREQRREDALVERLQLARAAVGVGALPRAQLVLAMQGAQHELAERTTSLATSQALLGTARLTVPVWLVEPAVELGARAVLGGGLDPALAGTARVEAAIRVGPAAVGAGVVLIGYTGTGLEAITLDPAAPPVYLVVRGALP